MDEKVLAILQQRRSELAAIEATWANWSRVTEWHARTRPLIAQYFEQQIMPFDELIKVRFTVSLGAIALDGDGRASRGGATRPTNDRKAVSRKG